MLRSKIQHLLTFHAAAAEPPIKEAPDLPPDSMGGWMSSIGATPGSQSDDNKEVKTDGTGNKADAGNNDALGNHPISNSPADKSGDEATANADKQRIAESKASEDAKANAAAKAEADEQAKKEAGEGDKSKSDKEKSGEEKWPRTHTDWDTFKKNRKEERERLEKEIKVRDENIVALQGQIKEAKEASAKAGTPSPEMQKELEQVKAERDAYSQRLQEVEVTAHPKFQTYFNQKRDAQISLAKKVVGSDKAEAIEKILKLPDSPDYADYKTAKLNDFISDLDPLQTSRIGTVLNALEEITLERESEIAKAKEHAGKIAGETTEKQKAAIKQNEAMRDKLFNDAIESARDAKTGLAVYQEREGDAEWNKGVEQRTAIAKRLLFGGKDLKPEEVARAALHAAAFPSILEAYQADSKRWETEMVTLREQVKKMTAAQPGKGGALSKPQSDEAGKTGSSVKDGMNPFEASKAFAQDMMAARNAE